MKDLYIRPSLTYAILKSFLSRNCHGHTNGQWRQFWNVEVRHDGPSVSWCTFFCIKTCIWNLVYSQSLLIRFCQWCDNWSNHAKVELANVHQPQVINCFYGVGHIKPRKADYKRFHITAWVIVHSHCLQNLLPGSSDQVALTERRNIFFRCILRQQSCGKKRVNRITLFNRFKDFLTRHQCAEKL